MKYTVKGASLATGISESRLRTWERRYGIPKPGRSPASRRAYEEADLAVIRRMAALVDAGVSAADAAEAVRSGESAPAEVVEAPLEHLLTPILVGAAKSYDERTLIEALQEAVDELGWARALEDVVFPALRRLGAEWEKEALSPAKEHFAAELIRREILAAVGELPLSAATSSPVLMACPESERHDLGLAALSLVLRQDGLRVVYLGADVPATDLADAWQTLRPEAVILSATTAGGLASLVRTALMLLSQRGVRLYVGGPAVAIGSDTAGIHLPASLEAAARRIVTDLRMHRRI